MSAEGHGSDGFRTLDHPEMFATHTPDSWARAVLGAGLRALVARHSSEDPTRGISTDFNATLQITRHSIRRASATLEFEGQHFSFLVVSPLGPED